MTERLPFALDLPGFLRLELEERRPLLGTADNAAIVAGGLILLGGQAGLGKTTLIVDAIFHLASGRDWLEFHVDRPLNILVIENEGPLRMFQQKLAAKAKAWQHDLQGEIHVQTGAWGYFSFADVDHHTRLAEYLDEHRIDLVVGDPIATLGLEGVGAPDETRQFVKLLIPLGLFDKRAFLFPVHFTKEARKDEINQISGAWGGHLDTLMVLKATRRRDEVRLSFPKLRWWSAQTPSPLILGKVYNTHAFEILRREGDPEPIDDRLVELLSDGVWRTVPEIASKDTGIEGGARRDEVKKALEARPDLYYSQPGNMHGRSAKAVVWSLVPESGTSQPAKTAQQSQMRLVPGLRDESGQSDESAEDSLVPAQRDEWDESDESPPGGTATHSSPGTPPKGGTGTSDKPRAPADSSHTRDQSTGNGHADNADKVVAEELWMHPDPATAIVERWPMLPAHELERLIALAFQIAEREGAGPEPEP